MTSPIAVEDQPPRHSHAVLQDSLASARRLEALAERIALHIESLVPRGRARCLDVGGDATLDGAALGAAVQDRLARVDWRRGDVHALAAEARTCDDRIAQLEARELDIALLRDVLHRSGKGAQLLEAAGRLTRHVLVKDRFDRYLTRESLARLAGDQQFAIAALDCGLSLYERAPVARMLVARECDFIAVLRRRVG